MWSIFAGIFGAKIEMAVWHILYAIGEIANPWAEK